MSRALGVLFCVSAHEAAWREALTAAATAAGWSVTAADAEAAEPPGGATGGRLVLSALSGSAPGLAPGDWVVLAERPDLAIAQVRAALPGATPREIAWHAAVRFALASTLADAGAPVLDGAATTLDFPGLGPVTRGGSGAQRPPATGAGGLDCYAKLPPPVGAQADWTPDLFTFMGGEAEIDLTGRARLVLFGPHLDLPPGRWRATARLEIDPEGAARRLRFEWGAEPDYAEAVVRIEAAGVYTLTLDHAWTGIGAAQLRVWVEAPAFGGRLRLDGVGIERIA